MSAITEDDRRSATPTSSNRLGWLFGARAKPVTIAPISASQNESQAPLNPVCPVIKTLLPRQNSVVTAKPSKAPFLRSRVLRDKLCRARYPSAARSLRDGMREVAPLGINAPAV